MRGAIVLLISLGCVSTASAQIHSNPAQYYINQSMYSSRVFNGAIANEMHHPAGGAKRGTGAAATAAKDPRDVTRFTAAATSLMPAKMAASLAKTEADRRNAQAQLEQYLVLYRQTAQQDGFPADDLAYAYEYFIVNHWQIHHDLVNVRPEIDPRLRGARDGFERIERIAQKRIEQVSPSQERRIYDQFRERLASSAEVRSMTDAEKQEATEMMAIAFGANYTAYLSGLERGDDALAERSRQLAKQGLEKLLGMPLAQIRIDDRGLAP